MKRLVLFGEGEGDVIALPVLVKRLLQDAGAENTFFADTDVIRTGNPAGLVKWNKQQNCAEYEKWRRYIRIAARRPGIGGILAIFDGDAHLFPAGSPSPFCAATAARSMAQAALEAGAAKQFSVAVVFACSEYESWIVAGAKSLEGKQFKDGRPIFRKDVRFPSGDHEVRGKRWLEENCFSYRPTRDQRELTELIDLDLVRENQVRSFRRLENALSQLTKAVTANSHISTPA